MIFPRAAARTQPTGPAWAEFASVAVTPETIFVAGNPVQDGKRGPGTVHVFERRSADWVSIQMLAVPESVPGDAFGISMMADGDTLVVGAQFADARGDDSGQAYVFERRNRRWHQAAVLSATDGAAGDQFGLTVSVSGGDDRRRRAAGGYARVQRRCRLRVPAPGRQLAAGRQADGE